ncbi:pteridine reductase [Gammaproteobacteria bacterium]
MPQTALITGAAHRVGAAIARALHGAGMNVVLHYRSSAEAVRSLCEELETARPDSVVTLQADLLAFDNLSALVDQTVAAWGRLDCLVNNASTFYPTPLEQATAPQWDDLLGTNLRAPFFLSQAAAPWLRITGGNIVNIVDIYAERPLKDHPIYSIAKAGLTMLTKALARELGPQVRVNAVAPGTILWPERPVSDTYKTNLLARTTLNRLGSPTEVARAVLFLVQSATYTSGHILTVDGGRSLMP